MKTGTKLRHQKHGYIVIFKCMINGGRFRTEDDFILNINEFAIVQ